jgi:para-nitrobenzyl esterase
MDDVVTTASGSVKGRRRDGVSSFLGIPYAAPPFGASRLRGPEPPDPWDGIRDALAFGPTAPSPSFAPPLDALLPDVQVPGEDCLNLNVWTPDPGAAGLPVMVWIHGGAFRNGSSGVPWYCGDRFARDGVVCVTLNYRLGCEGFLLLDDGPANRGILDQLAALEWVQSNIRAFGGDPDNVTVFGVSAGAMSVVTLLSMPQAAGLFHRAVAQSGAGHQILTADTARSVTHELARRLGIEPTTAAFAIVPADRLFDDQRRLSDDIESEPEPDRWGEIGLDTLPLAPVLDGAVLAARPMERLAAGAAGDVDLLIGTNRDELRLYLVPNGVIDLIDAGVLAGFATRLGLDPAGVAAYEESPESTPGEVFADVYTDWYFRIPAIRTAEAHQGRSHLYEFAWGSPLFDGRLGACHALEVGFVFDTLDEAGGGPLWGPAPPRRLATAMHGAWVAFATSGDPGWEPYGPDRRATMCFDAQSSVVSDPRSARRAVWDGIR